MLGFQNRLWKTINQGDFHNFKLLENEDYISSNGVRYRLPKSCPSDLASTPSAIWGPPFFLPPFGWYSMPCFLHDAGYRNYLLIVNSDGSTKIANLSKEECDNLLLESMNSLGELTQFQKIQRDEIYKGVCYGGYHSYNEDRE